MSDNMLDIPLLLKETVIVEIFRGYRGYYLDVSDENPQVVDLIVNNGRSYIASRIAHGDSVASAMAYMAVGTGTTVATLTDTALGGEVTRKTFAVGSANNNVWSAVATFGGAADSVTSVQLTEAAILNAPSGGTMMQRVTFSAVTLANSDMLKITLNTNIGSNTI